MSTTVSYKGSTIATVENTTKTLLTQGKYLEANILVTDSGGGGGGVTQYDVTQTLTNVTSSTNATKATAGESFFCELTPAAGYVISTITVTMGGVDITSQVFAPGLGTKTITANDTYDAEDDDLSGYSSVTVNVPNSYTAGDEGKVVNNGALVAQTSDTVTQNGTVDTTLINSLTVNVSGGITPTGAKQISITSNGTTTEDVTNYASAEITANVPNTYTAGDEGKVVSGGALVSQTSDTVTQNGTVDTTLINSLTVNVSGSSEPDCAIRLKNFVIQSSKWKLENAIPNYLASGGCVHLVYTLQYNSSTSNDLQIVSFGYGAMSSWSPGTTNIATYILVGKGQSNLVINFRGSGNTNLNLDQYADQNGKVDIKFYTNKYVDVNTNTEYTYSTGAQTFMTALAQKTRLSVSINQSNPFSGATVSLFAIEDR